MNLASINALLDAAAADWAANPERLDVEVRLSAVATPEGRTIWRVTARPPKGRDGHNWQLHYFPPHNKGKPGKKGQPYQRSAGTRDGDEAARMAAAEEARLNGHSLPLPEVLRRYLDWRASRPGRSPGRTLATYESRAKRLIEVHGLGPIDRVSVLRLQDRLGAELAARTVNQHLSLARSAWNWALARRMVTVPWPDPSRLEEQETRLRPCTPSEAHKLLDDLGSYAGGHYYAIMAVLFDVGSRVSETCLLREQDLDRERSEIRFVHVKGGRSRTAVVSPDVLALIPRREPSAWCFPRRDDESQPLNRNLVYHAFRCAMERCGLRDQPLSPHSLRRSWITDSLREGVGVGQSMLQTGHTSVAVHMGYRRNAPSKAQREAHAIVAACRPPLPHQTPPECGGVLLQRALQQGGAKPTRSGCSADSDPTSAQEGLCGPNAPHVATLKRLADLGEEERQALRALATDPNLQALIGRALPK